MKTHANRWIDTRNGDRKAASCLRYQTIPIELLREEYIPISINIQKDISHDFSVIITCSYEYKLPAELWLCILIMRTTEIQV